MGKQEWINKAYDRLVARGVCADEKTWDWAELIYDQADAQDDPADSVDEELSCV